MAFGTRGASAASSTRAKQELVRLLFGHQLVLRGPASHRLMDHSIYTHAQLKSAYLNRIQELHPDKRRQEIQTSKNDKDMGHEFIALQEAWSQYSEFSKALTKASNGSREANFTMFGVGCSFSDNEAERIRRNEITDQACRGWFSAGQIGVGEEDKNATNNPMEKPPCSLLDENMFVAEDDVRVVVPPPKGKLKSLVDHNNRTGPK